MVRATIGVNATGLPFDSLAALEQAPQGRTNPMVNPGPIATTGLTPGSSAEQRWAFLADGIVTAAPGKGGLGTFSPRLDGAGNSVRGMRAARMLSGRLGLDIFASAPASSA